MELCRKGGFSDATFYKWRAKYGGTDVPDANASAAPAALGLSRDFLGPYPIGYTVAV
jgi:hypothetical protein